MRNQGFWTDDRIEQLKVLFGENLSAAQIAGRMHLTRNAVLGKLHRLGLSLEKTRLSDEERASRLKAREQLKAERDHRRYENKKMKEIPPMIDPTPVFEGALNIPFGDLRPFSSEANQCRYIAAEPAGPDYLACGNETLPGESWCGHCHELVHAPPRVLSEQDLLRRRLHMKRLTTALVVRKGLDLSDEAA